MGEGVARMGGGGWTPQSCSLRRVHSIQMGRSHSLTIGRNLIYYRGRGSVKLGGGLLTTVVFATTGQEISNYDTFVIWRE